MAGPGAAVFALPRLCVPHTTPAARPTVVALVAGPEPASEVRRGQLRGGAAVVLAAAVAARPRCQSWHVGRVARRRGRPHCRVVAHSVSELKSAGAIDDEVEVTFEQDAAGRLRLRYQPEGWMNWTWSPDTVPGGPYECHYVAAGPADAPAVVLVHGFGANAYHWRYQVPSLAKQGFRVYSVCLLGYGWSPRAVLRFSGEVWAEQINAFLRDIVGRPAVLVGNSVGAFASLLAASFEPDLCRGLVLLNAAGRFEERQEPSNKAQVGDLVGQAADEAEPGPVQWLLDQIAKTFAAWAFYTTKLRIQPILQWVYVNDDQCDDDLVESIRTPAEHPNALDCFSQVIQAGRRTEVSVFQALDKLPTSLRVLLLWGMQDPWMRPERAEAIRQECACRGLSCEYVELDEAGHCPQDDLPEDVNASLVRWLGSLDGPGPAKAKEEECELTPTPA